MRLRISSSAALRSSRLGMTLVEILVATGVAGIVFMAVASMSLFTARSFVAMGNYADLDRASQNALDRMSREIRQTKGLVYYSQNVLVFQELDGSYLYYYFIPDDARLYRHKTNTSVLLEGCDQLSFQISQRNPSNNFQFYPVQPNRPDLAKLIDVSWRCSRKIFGQKINTESVQTAKIVMRN